MSTSEAHRSHLELQLIVFDYKSLDFQPLASLVSCHCSGAIRHFDPTLPELVEAELP